MQFERKNKICLYLLRHLNINKPTGPDGIPNIILEKEKFLNEQLVVGWRRTMPFMIANMDYSLILTPSSF